MSGEAAQLAGARLPLARFLLFFRRDAGPTGTAAQHQGATRPIIKEGNLMALQADLLEHSFGEVAAQGEAFAAAFYERLFALAPESRPLFATTTMDQQEKKLLAALGLVMEHLRKPETLAPVLKHLGERHLAYEVTPDGFEVGGAALLETLRLFLGERWTPELEAAWAEAYGMMVTLMLEAGE